MPAPTAWASHPSLLLNSPPCLHRGCALCLLVSTFKVQLNRRAGCSVGPECPVVTTFSLQTPAPALLMARALGHMGERGKGAPLPFPCTRHASCPLHHCPVCLCPVPSGVEGKGENPNVIWVFFYDASAQVPFLRQPVHPSPLRPLSAHLSSH